jgi:hypothetical protein
MAATKIDYDQTLVEAAQRVLLELARILHEYHQGIVVVGGSVPGLLFSPPSQDHIGTIDIDLALDHRKIQEVGYRSILKILL